MPRLQQARNSGDEWMPTSRVRFKNGRTAEIQADNSVRHCLSNVSSRTRVGGRCAVAIAGRNDRGDVVGGCVSVARHAGRAV